MCEEWETENNKDQILTFTRLIQSMRSIAGKSDIIPVLEKVAKRAQLEDKDIDNHQDEYR